MSNYDDDESFAADEERDFFYEFRLPKVVVHARLQQVMDDIPSGALRVAIAHRLLVLLEQATNDHRGD